MYLSACITQRECALVPLLAVHGARWITLALLGNKTYGTSGEDELENLVTQFTRES